MSSVMDLLEAAAHGVSELDVNPKAIIAWVDVNAVAVFLTKHAVNNLHNDFVLYLYLLPQNTPTRVLF